MKTRKRTIYMCGVEWQHEMSDQSGAPFRWGFTLDEVKQRCCCWEECGIVEIELVEKSWPVEQNFHGPDGDNAA